MFMFRNAIEHFSSWVSHSNYIKLFNFTNILNLSIFLSLSTLNSCLEIFVAEMFLLQFAMILSFQLMKIFKLIIKNIYL